MADDSGAVLDNPYATEVVSDRVEDFVRARAGQQASALPASALKRDRAVRGLVEYYISEVESGRRPVADLRQRSVGGQGLTFSGKENCRFFISFIKYSFAFFLLSP